MRASPPRERARRSAVRVRRAPGLAALVLLVAVPGLAAAAPPQPRPPTAIAGVRLAWDAPAGLCPDQATLAGRLRALLGDRPLDLDARARVTGAAPRFRLELRLRWSGGGLDRDLAAEECETLAQATVVLVAVLAAPLAASQRLAAPPVLPPDPAGRASLPGESSPAVPPPGTATRPTPRPDAIADPPRPSARPPSADPSRSSGAAAPSRAADPSRPSSGAADPSRSSGAIDPSRSSGAIDPSRSSGAADPSRFSGGADPSRSSSGTTTDPSRLSSGAPSPVPGEPVLAGDPLAPPPPAGRAPAPIPADPRAPADPAGRAPAPLPADPRAPADPAGRAPAPLGTDAEASAPFPDDPLSDDRPPGPGAAASLAPPLRPIAARRRGPVARVSAVAGYGVLPRGDFGLALAFGWLFPRVRLEAGALLLPGQGLALPDGSGRGGTARFAVGLVRACPRFLGGPIELAVCGAVEAGGTWVTSIGLTPERRASGPWLAFALGGALDGWFSPQVGLHLAVDLVGAPVTTSYAIGGDALAVARPFGVRGLLGLTIALAPQKFGEAEKKRR